MFEGMRLDLNNVRDLTPDVLDAPGCPKIMPADYYRHTTMAERALFGHKHGIYLLPTIELVEWLKNAIGGRRAIEIGSGNGILAKALGIPATDNRMQEDPMIAMYYASARQPVVQYGDNVEKLDAAAAIEKYQPQVVLGAWVTHRYDSSRPEAGGNAYGVDEEALLDRCESYIFVGNEHVHSDKSIWSRPHRKLHPDWLFSRATSGKPEFIAIWGD